MVGYSSYEFIRDPDLPKSRNAPSRISGHVTRYTSFKSTPYLRYGHWSNSGSRNKHRDTQQTDLLAVKQSAPIFGLQRVKYFTNSHATLTPPRIRLILLFG